MSVTWKLHLLATNAHALVTRSAPKRYCKHPLLPARRHRQRVQDELGAAGGGRRLAGRAGRGAGAGRPRRPQPGRPAGRAGAHAARLAAPHPQGPR